MTAVIPPSARTTMLHHQAGVPMRSNAMRTATLVITPLISAETWLGAAGCASGNQTCSGTRPALEPAPISVRIKMEAASAAEGVRCADVGKGIGAVGTR